MCGFVGFLGGEATSGLAGDEAVLRRMADAVAHRGPDDDGYWCDVAQRIGFGHRRLAIVDLSPAGHQPMVSASGRYAMAFNGEIYNHLLMRRQLEDSALAPAWRGHSDTETLLAACDAWGIEGALQGSGGMFALALWDRDSSTLTLARDRIGEKPLYYGWQGSGSGAVFLFGSELKALRAHPSFVNAIDRGALSLYMRHNYIPAPYSIYKGIRKLVPGSMLTVSLQQREPMLHTFWSGAQSAVAARDQPFDGSAEQAVDALEGLLKDAVARQMMADVPLGAFLSGGVDSSAIVALMQVQSSRPVKTFTIGFDADGYDEAPHARAVAKHLGTEHTELYVSAEQALAVIPRLPTMYDEPFSDSSQIPTFLVSQLARQHVTVSLSGDAGDELFCGYNRYQITARMWRKLSRLPLPARRLAARSITSITPKAWNRLGQALADWLPRTGRLAHLGDKLHKGANVLTSASVDALYLGLVSHWDDPASVVLGTQEPPTLLTGNRPHLGAMDAVERMMALDLLTYLPDDILVKVDRAAMAVSLETRVPMLDHRVVEFAWSLPQSMKMRNGISKWVLREVLYRHVPRALIERPKMGFGVPLENWLRGPLRSWAEELLSESRLRRDGYFAPGPIRKKWDEHLSGRRNWQYHLWDVLMFQAWLDQGGASGFPMSASAAAPGLA